MVVNTSSTNANNEINAMLAENVQYMFVITSPSQSRIETGGATGTTYGDADATIASRQSPTVAAFYLERRSRDEIAAS